MTTRHYQAEDGITGYAAGDVLIDDTTGERGELTELLTEQEAHVIEALERGPLTALELCAEALPNSALRTVHAVLRRLRRSGRVASVRGRRAFLRRWHLIAAAPR